MATIEFLTYQFLLPILTSALSAAFSISMGFIWCNNWDCCHWDVLLFSRLRMEGMDWNRIWSMWCMQYTYTIVKCSNLPINKIHLSLLKFMILYSNKQWNFFNLYSIWWTQHSLVAFLSFDVRFFGNVYQNFQTNFLKDFSHCLTYKDIDLLSPNPQLFLLPWVLWIRCLVPKLRSLLCSKQRADP